MWESVLLEEKARAMANMWSASTKSRLLSCDKKKVKKTYSCVLCKMRDKCSKERYDEMSEEVGH